MHPFAFRGSNQEVSMAIAVFVRKTCLYFLTPPVQEEFETLFS